MPNGFRFNPMSASTMACPTCGYTPAGAPTMGMMGGPWMGAGIPYGMMPQMGAGIPYGMMPQMGPWLGGPMTWGGTFPGMFPSPAWAGAAGVPSDDQIREMIYDAIDADPVIPYESDINIDVTGGVVTLSGTVPNKRVKHSVGDDAWWVPGVWDVNNALEIAGPRERAAAPRRRPTTTPAAKETRRGK